MGTLDLAIPRVRQGSYLPEWLLEPRRRAERALVAVVAECYVMGVSTRKVEGIAQSMGIQGLSKSQVSEMAKSLDAAVETFRTRPLDEGPYPYVWMDALVVKSREVGRVVNVAVIVATAVNREGRKVILGLDVVTSEATTHGSWGVPESLTTSARHVPEWERLSHGGSGRRSCTQRIARFMAGVPNRQASRSTILENHPGGWKPR